MIRLDIRSPGCCCPPTTSRLATVHAGANQSDVKQFPKERWDTPLRWHDDIYMWNFICITHIHGWSIMKLSANHEAPKTSKTALTSETLSLKLRGMYTQSLSNIEWVERVLSSQGGRRAPSGSLGIALEVWDAVRCHGIDWIDWIDQLHSVHDFVMYG